MVGAGVGTKVVGVCASICSSTSSSSSPSTLTGPPGRHHIHRTLHGESIKSDGCGGVAVTDFVTAVAGGGGAADPDDRWHRPPVCLVTTCTAHGARSGAASASPVNE